MDVDAIRNQLKHRRKNMLKEGRKNAKVDKQVKDMNHMIQIQLLVNNANLHCVVHCDCCMYLE